MSLLSGEYISVYGVTDKKKYPTGSEQPKKVVLVEKRAESS